MRKFTFVFIVILELILKTKTLNSEIINISNYSYPLPDDPDIYYIAIMGTNDLHGTYFPLESPNPVTNSTYTTGGLDYYGKYIQIMRAQWKERFLWLDAGDQFSGGLETKISEGELITEFYNKMKLDAATFGNHEWDFGFEYLDKRLHNSNFSYLAANIKNKTTEQTEFLYNQKRSQIFQVGEIKLGVIGLANFVKKETSSGFFTDVEFKTYKAAILLEIEQLRKETDAVIILGHIALNCPKSEEALKLQIFTKDTPQKECDESTEMMQFLKTLDNGIVDAIIAGHSHDETHNWPFGFPVMSSINFGQTSNIMYLPFNRKTKKLIKDKIQIEGPLPVCEKVFKNYNACPQAMTEEEIIAGGELLPYSFHGVEIKAAEELKELSDYWWKQYESFKKDKVTAITESLGVTKIKESALGNLYTDIMRKITGADIGIETAGAFRVTWSKGNLSAADILSMTPYDNFISTFGMKGKDVRRMFYNLHEGSYTALTSGVVQVVRKKPVKKLVSIKIFDGINEIEIEDEKIYKIACVDFLYPKGGDDFKKVVKWFKNPIDLKILNILSGDIIKYLRNVDLIEVNKLINEEHPGLRIIE